VDGGRGDIISGARPPGVRRPTQGANVSGDRPEGWYPDPDQPGSERFWFGQRWTEQTRPAGSGTPVLPPSQTSGPPAWQSSLGRRLRYTTRGGFQKRRFFLAIGVIVVTFIFAFTVGALTNHHSDLSPIKVAVVLPAATMGSTVLIGGTNGDRLGVRVVKVIDPSSPGEGFSDAGPGKRYVAVEMVVANRGSATLEDDADADLAVVGSDRHTYGSDFETAAECPNFANGAFTVKRGASASGCVGFELPVGVAVKRVTFSLASDDSPQTGVWLNR
jgi:hypothetical protein